MNPLVDAYFSDGCGRCPLGGTPQCKIHQWQAPMGQLRMILLGCGLTETRKWGVACYMFQKRNLILLSALNDCCTLSFLNGALLKDTEGLLSKPGENTQQARLIRFVSLQEVLDMEPLLKALIQEAIAVEKTGNKFMYKKLEEYSVPEELNIKMNEMPALKAAFSALTPGRQKGYLLYFSAPRQPGTRMARIEKCISMIMAGKGLHDGYPAEKKAARR